jgi:hypothetical protein
MWCAQVTDFSIDTEFYVGSVAPPYALDAPLVGGDRYYTNGLAVQLSRTRSLSSTGTVMAWKN